MDQSLMFGRKYNREISGIIYDEEQNNLFFGLGVLVSANCTPSSSSLREDNMISVHQSNSVVRDDSW